MFCHQCGEEITDGAEFCHKCGTKVVRIESPPPEREQTGETTPPPPTPQAEALYDVILVHGGSRSIDVIKAVKACLGLNLRDAKDLVDHAPAILKKSAERAEAGPIWASLEKVGASVELVPPNSRQVYELPVREPNSKTSENESVSSSETTKDSWWSRSSSAIKVLGVLGIIAAVILGLGVLTALICLIVAHWDSIKQLGIIIFGIFVILALLYGLFVGTKEEKIEARKTLIQVVGWIAAIAVIVIFLARNPNIVSRLIRPGAEVRDAYLEQYSKSITIETAFDNFFADEKWETYDSDGYTYVSFTGTCTYLDKPADVRIVFKITGERFVLDHVDINGQEQNDLIETMLMGKIYEKY